MRRFGSMARVGCLLIVTMSLCAASASAQGGWDADQYVEWVRQSDDLYESCRDAVEIATRNDLCNRSIETKEQALEMVRSAFLAGELDDYGERPRQNVFDLHENIVVINLELDQCAEAEIRLDYAMGDGLIMPEGAIDDLRQLRSVIEECETRVAAAPVIDEGNGAPAETPTEVVEVVDVSTSEEPADIADDLTETPGEEPVDTAEDGTETAEVETPEEPETERGQESTTEEVLATEDGSTDTESTGLELTETVPDEPGGRKLAVPLALGGGAVSALGTGIAFGILSNSRADDANNYDFSQPGAHSSERDALSQESEDFATIANICYIGAGVLAAGAVLTFFLLGPDDGEVNEDTPHVVFAPVTTPNFTGGVFQVSF